MKVSEKYEFKLISQVELRRVREALQHRLEDEGQSGRRAEVVLRPVGGSC